jgi:DNA mismatch repair protein MutS2
VKSLRLRERLDDLELVELAGPPKSKTDKLASLRDSRGTEVKLKPEENGSSELNVIGRTTDEAVDAVDKFLDQASMASLGKVRIIHGHGTGALRRAITEMLTDHPHVARFAAAPQDQGGSGATIVELRI